ncbi:MAG: phosphoribosyltransferase [Flammeovirgaceae bacterium TMED290]|nr:MAG: phosphoribosyltransferase [Flammeovirgaceae bacterium TMED290]|tara:strand:+ start:3769 stop:4263 length:495 start_codon:yes stop_codon:yes gene_type:complete
MKNIILNSDDIKNKISRISSEIIEKNFDKNKIFIVGLLPNGKYISKMITQYITKNSNLKIISIHFNYDKTKRKFCCEESDFNLYDFKNKTVIVLDDVMNSGSTIIYAINTILNYSPKNIQVGVLVERNYKNFPITPDYKGLELSTSPDEHVQVKLGSSPKVLII